jgi:hypothetical protein
LAYKHSETINGTLQIRTTASVQGMAMKEASRALINLFSCALQTQQTHQNVCVVPAPFSEDNSSFVQEQAPTAAPASSSAPVATSIAVAHGVTEVPSASAEVSSVAVSVTTELAVLQSEVQAVVPAATALECHKPVNCSASVVAASAATVPTQQKRKASLSSVRAARVAGNAGVSSSKPLQSQSARTSAAGAGKAATKPVTLPPLTSNDDIGVTSPVKTSATQASIAAQPNLDNDATGNQQSNSGPVSVSAAEEAVPLAASGPAVASSSSAAPNLSSSSSSKAASRSPRMITSPIGELFLSDRTPRPWVFNYYHKSGNIKDQFIAHLRFNAQGTHMYGRGQYSDANGGDGGLLVLYGQVELTIIGYVWMISLCNISLTSMFSMLANMSSSLSIHQWIVLNVGPLEFSDNVPSRVIVNSGNEDDDSLAVIVDDFYESNDEIVTAAFSSSFVSSSGATSSRGSSNGNNIKRKTTVVHTAYWSDGMMCDYHDNPPVVQAASLVNNDNAGDGAAGADPQFAELLESTATSCGVWGLGLWGVWEMADNGT